MKDFLVIIYDYALNRFANIIYEKTKMTVEVISEIICGTGDKVVISIVELDK